MEFVETKCNADTLKQDYNQSGRLGLSVSNSQNTYIEPLLPEAMYLYTAAAGKNKADDLGSKPLIAIWFFTL